MSTETKQIFLWHGDNDYEIHQQIKAWVTAFEKKHTGLNISSFDLAERRAKDQLFKDLKNALQVDSLFGSNKLIVLRNFLGSTSKIDKDSQELLLDVMTKLSKNFFLVFLQPDKPDSRTKLYKAIKKQGAFIKEFKLPRENELVRWILNRAKHYQASLVPEAVNLLSALVGSDLWQLDGELNKLANYKKGSARLVEDEAAEKITVADVNLLVKGKYNDDIFQLMDAISDKDKKKVLKLFQDQLDSGANEIYLLTMLIRQFRIFWQIKELTKDQQMTAETVAKELKMHPFVVKKSVYYLKHFTVEELQKIYQKLLEFEIKIKTGQAKFELLFDLLIAKL